MASQKKSREGLPARGRPSLSLVRPKTQAEQEEYQKLVEAFAEERSALLNLMANAERRMPYRELKAVREKWYSKRGKKRLPGFKQRVIGHCSELWQTSQVLLQPKDYFSDRIYHDERWTDFVELYRKGQRAARKEMAKKPEGKWARAAIAKAKAKKAPKNHKYYETHTKEARKVPEVAEAHRTSNRESKRRAHEKELDLRLRRIQWVWEAEATLRGERLRSKPDGSDLPWTQKELDDFRRGITKIKTIFGRSWARNWRSFEESGQPYKQSRSAP